MAINMTFVDFVTPVPADWLNNVNTVVNNFNPVTPALVVQSIASLRLVSHIANQTVFVTGYYNSHDGGGGAYSYDPIDTTSADNGGTIIVATDGGRWKLNITTSISVKQFGAHGDGVTDDTPFFNACIAAVSDIYIPTGTFNISKLNTITTNGMKITGAGQEVTFITGTSGTSGAMFVFGTGTGLTFGFEISGISFQSSVSNSACYVFSLLSAFNVFIHNCSSINGFFGFANIVGGSTITLTDVYSALITPTTGRFISITGNFINVNLVRFVTDGGPGTQPFAGMYVEDGQGITLTDCEFNHSGNGAYFNCATGKYCQFIFAVNVTFDTCSANGMYVNNNGGINQGFWFSNCWWGTNTQNGIYVLGNLDGLQLGDCKVANNYGNGILFGSGQSDFQVTGGLISGNGLSGGSPGINFGNSLTFNNVTLSGVQIGQADGFGNSQTYGLSGSGTTITNLIITGCNLVNNNTGAINFPAASLSPRNVTGNLGLVDQNAGVTVITNGNGSVTVNHGLSLPPGQADISVTPTSGWGAGGVTSWWISAVTATQFTIALNVATTANFSFAWQAKLH
jgi:Pectate lyase superfamily protein